MRILLAAALLATAAAPALADTRNYPVGRFDRLATYGPWDVRVHTGAAPSVRVTGTKDRLDYMTVGVVNGELKIGSRPGNWQSIFRWGQSERTIVDVTVPMLQAANLSGPGDLTVDRVRVPHFATKLSGPGNIRIGAIDTGFLEMDLSGPGDIIIAGKAGRARANLSGPGDIKGQSLTVGDVDVRLSGPGTIRLNAFGRATGHLSGPGDIYLGGHARCDISKSGPGDVHC